LSRLQTPPARRTRPFYLLERRRAQMERLPSGAVTLAFTDIDGSTALA
jgi:hypothetical protein